MHNSNPNPNVTLFFTGRGFLQIMAQQMRTPADDRNVYKLFIRGTRGNMGAVLSGGTEPHHVWLLRHGRRTLLDHLGSFVICSASL